jgi:hypothetical protein
MPLRAVMEIGLLSDMMILVPHKKQIDGSARPITGMALLFYVDDVRTLQETHL